MMAGLDPPEGKHELDIDLAEFEGRSSVPRQCLGE
jgi:hypothetical protein